jgi:putative oxidoreductase
MNQNSTYNTWAPRFLSLLRIVAGYLFMQHGIQKLFGALNFPGPQPPLMSQYGVGGVIEFVAGILIILGLFTRPAAFLAAGQMAVAYFQFHAPSGYPLFPVANKGEPAVLYCFLFLFYVFAGAGPWSLDAILARRREQSASMKQEPILSR